ncbi:MAG: hydroxymethylglutaryl-CoA lyase [Candidatus Caldatribacteriota bacterium]
MINDIQVIEVGPRDGLQNIKNYIPLDNKLKVIAMLYQAGLKNIEVTSFVSPKAIPQMKDAYQLVEEIKKQDLKDLKIITLVPNLYGARIAQELEVDRITYVISVSEKHNQNNIRRTHSESLNELEEIIKNYQNTKNSPEIKVGLATTFHCPFEGVQPVPKVINMLKILYEMGIRKFNFADTTGKANPIQLRTFWQEILPHIPNDVDYGIHFHDTDGFGLANILVSLEYQIKWIESSFGGFGGCPFAPGAAGNIATEDLLNFLDALKIRHGICKKEKLIEAVREIYPFSPNSLNSHVFRATFSEKCSL